ncbi:MAG: hypothetical protein WDA27_02825 [Actinomycetota bacterium]
MRTTDVMRRARLGVAAVLTCAALVACVNSKPGLAGQAVPVWHPAPSSIESDHLTLKKPFSCAKAPAGPGRFFPYIGNGRLRVDGPGNLRVKARIQVGATWYESDSRLSVGMAGVVRTFWLTDSTPVTPEWIPASGAPPARTGYLLIQSTASIKACSLTFDFVPR